MQIINSKRQLRKQNLAQLLDICIFNEVDYIESVLKNWLNIEGNNLDEYREKVENVGSLCLGTVILPTKTYRLAGFVLKITRSHLNEMTTKYLFVPVYSDVPIDYTTEPIIFQNCTCLADDHGFVEDDLGNLLHLDEILFEREEVQKWVNRTKYDLNKAIKSRGLFLNTQ